MDNLFNNILANVSADITIGSAIITMLVAVVFGAAIGFTYYKTQEENYQRSMAVTLLMLPIILSVIILFIGSNIIISANDYTVMNLKDFAFIAKQKGGNVIIRNAKRLTALECKSIAFINPGKITFDFTE